MATIYWHLRPLWWPEQMTSMRVFQCTQSQTCRRIEILTVQGNHSYWKLKLELGVLEVEHECILSELGSLSPMGPATRIFHSGHWSLVNSQ